jgi:hypothetical protein
MTAAAVPGCPGKEERAREGEQKERPDEVIGRKPEVGIIIGARDAGLDVGQNVDGQDNQREQGDRQVERRGLAGECRERHPGQIEAPIEGSGPRQRAIRRSRVVRPSRLARCSRART